MPTFEGFEWHGKLEQTDGRAELHDFRFYGTSRKDRPTLSHSRLCADRPCGAGLALLSADLSPRDALQGLLSRGFARLRWDGCAETRLVAR